jgi:hypothetical protein
MTFGLVISVYKEDISYLNDILEHFTNIYIYLKDETRYESIQQTYNNKKISIKVLENIGRESQTYVYHIEKYYNNLEDKILFIQGNPFDHIKYSILLEYITNNNFYDFYDFYDFIGLSNYMVICDEFGNPHHPNLSVKETYKQICKFLPFKKIIPDIYNFYQGAQFIVSRKNIHNYPIEMYSFLENEHRVNKDLPYVLERLWSYILDDSFKK